MPKASASRVLAFCAAVFTLNIGFLAAPHAFSAEDKQDPAPIVIGDPDSAKVLDPSQFQGRDKDYYIQARDHASTAKKLFCYCGCDMTESHTSLLDCFTDPSKHAVDCKECKDEIHMTAQMRDKGDQLPAIQQAIHGKYAKMYPFDEPTKAYANYLKTANLNFEKNVEAEPAPAKDTPGCCCCH